MENIRINAIKNVQHLGMLIFLCIVFSAILFFTIVKDASEIEVNATIFVFGLLTLLQFPLTIALHLNYLTVNKGDILCYDSRSGLFSFHHKNSCIKFSGEDIEKIIHYKSFALHKGNAQFLAWDYYHHIIITLKNHSEITLTSLLLGKDFNAISLPSEKVKVKMNLFRWARTTNIIETTKCL